MTWIKLEDEVADHPKIAGLSDRAFRWWIRSLCYCSRFLTDGAIPAIFLVGVKPRVREELITARLWIERESRLEIHDYLKYQTSRNDVEKERQRNKDRRKADRRTTGTTTGSTAGKPRPEIEVEVDTENREQTTATPSAPRPLVSGEANPRTWGKIHGEHVAGFCDWVCLPEFLFAEFSRKSTGDAYVKLWASKVRVDWAGKTIGDNLKFWRDRWNETHLAVAAKPDNAAHMARLEAIARGERKR